MTRYACDRIKLLQSYGLLTARYRAGPIPITPDYGPCRPIYLTAQGRPITGPFIDDPRPTDYRPIYRQPEAHGLQAHLSMARGPPITGPFIDGP